MDEFQCLHALGTIDEKSVDHEIHRAIEEDVERRKSESALREALAKRGKRRDELTVDLPGKEEPSINPNENIACDYGDDD